MHIKSVTAEAFGPLVSETLTLSPGLTVVHGDNESAKSSWHAAIYAALCGRRRGKGANRIEDREFADRRRPWDRNSWKVRCDVRLDDGRTVTLRHDLDGKVDCCAVDERGRDVSNEIMYDGAPDGSRWLGLNRRTFAATACVNQAELLRVIDAADDLQTDIQRAAATAGKDETAAAALAAVKKYSSDHVGLDRVTSRRPLRRALDDLEQASAAYEYAQRAHQDYLRLVVEAEAAHGAAAAAVVDRKAAEEANEAAERLVRAAQGLRSARAAAAQAQALAGEKRAKASASLARSTRAGTLSAAAPDAEPASSNDDAALAHRVARALGGWESAPDIPHLTGPSSQHLQAEIDGLPGQPEGDLAVDPTVERLHGDCVQATAVVERGERNRPQPPAVSDPAVAAAVEVDPSVLRRLVDRLTEPVPAVDSRLSAAVEAAARQRGQAAAAVHVAEQEESAALAVARQGSAAHSTPGASGFPTVAGSAGALLLAVAVTLVVLGEPVVGVVVATIAVGLVAVGVVLRRRPVDRGSDAPARSADTVDEQFEVARAHVRQCREVSASAEGAYLDARARLDAARTAASSGAARREAAVTEAGTLGLPADPAELRTLADVAERARSQREVFDRWHREYEADQRARRSSEERLLQALRDRGYDGDGDGHQGYIAYEQGCAARAEQARQAERCDELAARLRDRLASERAAERVQQVSDDARDELLRVARSIDLAVPIDSAGLTAPDAGVLAERLRSWLRDRGAVLEEVDQQRRRWQELQALLDGRSLEELQSAAAADAEAAEAAERQAHAATELLQSMAEALNAAATEAAADTPVDESAAQALSLSRRQRLERARDLETALCRAASSQQGKVAERELSIPNVAEAEEALERSRREVERVRSLGQVLQLTESFLETAQETTYNNLAPVLGSALERWLPEVTGGRYRRARVDPETLAVRVESAAGVLRRAELLSVGTAEQVYLLLRVALTEHLADTSAVSPLLFDDVTVQADPTRTAAILQMCKALADEGRQVVLFAQEQSVVEWAQSNLDGARHSLVQLTVPAAA